jgi:uncharacterized protein
MEIDLTHLDTDGVRVSEAFGGEELVAESPDERYRPLRAELAAWVRRERALARATGDLAATIRTECDRCLKPLDLEVANAFDQRYVWGGEAAAGEEAEVDLGELDVERLATPVIDTRALAREQLELAAPIRVVCSENCLGLCPSCGTDLNAGPCGCDAEPVDPRWEALKDFKKS